MSSELKFRETIQKAKNVIALAKSKIFLVIFYGDCQSSQGFLETTEVAGTLF